MSRTNIQARAVEVSRESLEAVARICGSSSAAAQAIRDADARIAAGQQVAFYKTGSRLLVVQVGGEA